MLLVMYGINCYFFIQQNTSEPFSLWDFDWTLKKWRIFIALLFSMPWGKSLGRIINQLIWLRLSQKKFMTFSLFCLPQHFFMMTSLIFIRHFSNWSFLCIYCSVYFLRICYHLFQSYWVVLCAYEKIVAPLPFIFC